MPEEFRIINTPTTQWLEMPGHLINLCHVSHIEDDHNGTVLYYAAGGCLPIGGITAAKLIAAIRVDSMGRT